MSELTHSPFILPARLVPETAFIRFQDVSAKARNMFCSGTFER